MYLISKGPFQPITGKFRANEAISKGKQNSFSENWYKEFPFLEYSPSIDRSFCFACSLFEANTDRAQSKWSSEGVNRSDKMKSRGQKKRGKLVDHFTSAAHKLAVDRLEHFQHRNIHIDVAISKARKQQLSMENQERLRKRKVIKLLLDCSRYLARQSLAFRGGDDAEGNFAQLVCLLARWTPFIDYWLTSSHSRPDQVTYMSAMSQNEFIGLLGDEVRKILISEVISSGAYAVMADTTPDISHADQISLVIRYVNDNLEIKERLMKISQIKGKTGDEFGQKVISMLKDLQIPLSQVLFQCYYTTASMSGAYNGAQAKLSEHLKLKIPYITGLGHKANLCVEHSCKASLMKYRADYVAFPSTAMRFPIHYYSNAGRRVYI